VKTVDNTGIDPKKKEDLTAVRGLRNYKAKTKIKHHE